MANSSAVCTSFKAEVLKGIHALDTTVARGGTTKDTIMGALFLASASLGASTTTYSATGEIGNSGSYAAGGIEVTNTAGQVVNSSTSGVWTPSGSWSTGSGFTSSGAFDAILIYNSTQGNKAIEVINFGSQTVTSGTFTLTMPTNDSSTALLRLA